MKATQLEGGIAGRCLWIESEGSVRMTAAAMIDAAVGASVDFIHAESPGSGRVLFNRYRAEIIAVAVGGRFPGADEDIIALVEEIRRNERRLPIVVTSGTPDRNDQLMAVAGEFSYSRPKPWDQQSDPGVFIAAILRGENPPRILPNPPVAAST